MSLIDTCFVLGNGPSLANVDAVTLQKYHTFGTNRIYLRYIPTYYVCINQLIAEQSRERIIKMRCKKFITDRVDIPHATLLHSSQDGDFSMNPVLGVSEGGTVTYVCIQIAYWLGFRKIYLLGVDHRYTYPGLPNEEIKWTGTDTNHFSSSYMQPGEKWNCPDLYASERYYQIAKDVFDLFGGEIINLTENSALNVFKKMTVKEFEEAKL